MSYAIIEASPEARKLITDYTDKNDTSPNEHHRVKYPLSEVKVGYCFTVPFAEANEVGLRASATNYGKKVGKKFTVIKHSKYECFEVARIA